MVIQLKNEKTNELFTSKEQTAQYRLHAVPRPFALQKKFLTRRFRQSYRLVRRMKRWQPVTRVTSPRGDARIVGGYLGDPSR
jgi:hypothetical protein